MTRASIEIDHKSIISSHLDNTPELVDIYIPCPICHGTTDTDDHGNVFCCSCSQIWSILGKPLREMQAILHVGCPTARDSILK